MNIADAGADVPDVSVRRVGSVIVGRLKFFRDMGVIFEHRSTAGDIDDDGIE